MSRCPKCAEAYQDQSVHTIAQNAGLMTCMIECLQCGQSILLQIASKSEEIRCIGILTDCKQADLMKLRDGEPVSIEDALGVGEALQLDKFLEIE